MKKFLLIAFFLTTHAWADNVTVAKFGLLNNNNNSVVINPSQAQDLLNVDVAPGGTSVSKRDGYGLYKALSTSKPLHGGFHAYDSTGNDYQLWGSSTSLYGIVADGTPTQLVSSTTLNSTWDCADTQGNSYCVNSSRDFMIVTAGATTVFVSSANAKGTMVESTPDRLVVAGVSGSPNTLFVSQSNTFTNFATGVNATDAFSEVIASPGSKLTHIRWGCGKLLWWKDLSFGYLDFDDQYSAQVKTVSDIIGTFDNTSAVDPGGQVWFRGQDGHTYKYDCSILTKESIDITPNVSVSGRRTTNSWTQTSASDFNSGSGVNIDTTSVQGSVVLVSSSDGFSSLAAWNTSTSTCPWTASGGFAYPTSDPGALHCGLIMTNAVSPAIPANFVLHYQFKFANTGTNNGAEAAFTTSSGTGYCLKVQGGASGSITSSPFSANTCGINFSSSTAIVDTNLHSADLIRSATGYMQIYLDGVRMGSYQDTTYSGMDRVSIANACADASCSVATKIDNVYVSASSGTYYSAVKNAPNITGWSTLVVNQQLNDGAEAYYLRSSTNSFSVTSSTPAWTSQTINSLITISTGTYFQLADTFTITYATQAPALNDFTINWLEGTASDQAYMLYFDNAIWESVSFSSATNNYIFKYDLINQGWTLYNFGAGGMCVQNNVLYFGDTSTTGGNIFNFGSATSDNGTAINAYWRSKSFTGSDPFMQNQLDRINTFAKKDQGSTLTATYTMDTSSSTSYSVGLSTANTVIQNRKLIAPGKLGYTFDFKLGDTSTSSAWEIFGFRIEFTQLPYRPSL